MTRPGSQPSIITCPLSGPGPSTTPSVHLYSSSLYTPGVQYTPPSLTRRVSPSLARIRRSRSRCSVCRIEASTASIREHEAGSELSRTTRPLRRLLQAATAALQSLASLAQLQGLFTEQRMQLCCSFKTRSISSFSVHTRPHFPKHIIQLLF